MGVYSFFLALTTVTVFLRTYCRVFVLNNFGLDDWLAVTAWVRYATYGIATIVIPLYADNYSSDFFCHLCYFRYNGYAPWHRSTRLGHPTTHGNSHWAKGEFYEYLVVRPYN